MAAADAAVPSESGAVEVVGLDAEPAVAGIADPLAVTVRFRLKEPVRGAAWTLRYTVDVAGKARHVVELGGSGAPADLAAGEHEWAYTVEAMGAKAEGVKAKHLTRNVGLLSLQLTGATGEAAAGEGLLEIRMITQIEHSKDASGGFRRTVFNPLAE